ncbi:MAG TPA: hypothetical protein VN698_13235 [Bacteroidia bacterium]|nr:hypothetical protein [Bacteroidia bacterium]
MKKQLIILFAFYFFLTSIGVVFGTHYCGTRSSNTVWNISVTKSNGCDCKHKSDSKHKNKCCKDTTKWIKANTDISKVQANFQFTKTQIAPIGFSISIFNFFGVYKTKNIAYSVSHSPPLPDLPLFLKKRSLLI